MKGWTEVGSKLHNVVQNLTIRSYPCPTSPKQRGSYVPPMFHVGECVMKLENSFSSFII